MKNNKKEGVVNSIIHPLAHEFSIKDLLQVVIGASILAIPIGFTEETWRLGETLPLFNVILVMLLTLLFISLFTYYHYYHKIQIEGYDELFKRVFATYIVSLIVVSILLGLIQQTPWTTNWLLSFKRVVIVALPSSMSAVVADVLK